MKRPSARAILAALTATVLQACGSSPATGNAVKADNCVVRLHGKGDRGSPTVVSNGIADVSPTGNADGWGGRQWVYFPDGQYAVARDVVSASADAAGCRRVVIDGFSNGASFAASMLCHGETLGGRVVGIVIDDPVTDAATEHCKRSAATKVALYWSGALDAQAPAGTLCSTIDWTCEGGVILGIDAFAADIGASIHTTPSQQHDWYRDAPELTAWFASP